MDARSEGWGRAEGPAVAERDVVRAAEAAGNFKTLSRLLARAGLVEMLRGAGPYTLSVRNR